DLYPESLHVSRSGLNSKDDMLIWEFARTHQFVIVTKDRDFRELSLSLGAPPKLIWICLGNCSTKRIERALRRQAVQIADFMSRAESSTLVIAR
ncbi:MAG: DUF5615 family PIN-like protein, partial [Bryobacteraceae bacterium]